MSHKSWSLQLDSRLRVLSVTNLRSLANVAGQGLTYSKIYRRIDLLVTQRHQRIDFRGAARRNVTGERGDDGEQEHDASES